MMRAFSTRCTSSKACGRPCSVASACRSVPAHSEGALDRRAALISVAGGLAAAVAQPCFPALADEEGFETYFGLASPPTSYGGYGGNLKETPKYKFMYPQDWKIAVVNKVQKGTQGIDSIIYNPKSKTQKAFLVTLSRAGEDNKSFRLSDYENTLSSFVGADYELQEAVASADEIQFEKREINGQVFYDYLIQGNDLVYRATITTDSGKVFAFFVRVPARGYNNFKGTMDTMLYSFRTL